MVRLQCLLFVFLQKLWCKITFRFSFRHNVCDLLVKKTLKRLKTFCNFFFKKSLWKVMQNGKKNNFRKKINLRLLLQLGPRICGSYLEQIHICKTRWRTELNLLNCSAPEKADSWFLIWNFGKVNNQQNSKAAARILDRDGKPQVP